MSTFSIPGVGATAVPAIQFTPQGPAIPTDTDILAGAQIDINYAFGGGVNPALETPQGQLASSLAAIVSDKDAQIAYICNQVDPRYSTGRFQDAIGRIYYQTRKDAASTVVTCVIGGVVGATLPAGTFAQDTSGNTYTLLGNVTIGGDGTVIGTFANIATGPIPCPASTLVKVYQTVPGWDTITNPSDGSLGQDIESPSEFEIRRKNSVALNSRGTTNAIKANVFAVSNVLDCLVLDNPSGQTVPTGSTNYPMLPHSIYVAVLGGLDVDIANAIWLRKDGGCDYNGNTTVMVFDSSYSYPQPQYPVKFQRPNPLSIFFSVEITSVASLPANIVDSVKAAIVARFSGTDGTNRERIGSTILASRYYATIGALADSLVLLGVQVGIAANPTGVSLQVGIDQSPTLNLNNISVTLT